MNRASIIELTSLNHSLLAHTEEIKTKPMPVVHVPPGVIEGLYNGASTADLTENFAQSFDFSELFFSLGPYLGPVMWLFLKSSPADMQRKILSTLSPFRSGVKSVRTLDQTAAIGGAPGISSPVGAGICASIGIAVGLLITAFITPEIKLLEEQLQRKIELNQLLQKYIEAGNTQVPKGLSQIQLINWLKNPTESSFAHLELRDIEENDFQDFSIKEANRLTWLKMLAEITNAIYAVSVLNTDLSLLSISGYMSNHISLGFNLITGVALVATYYRIANHHVQGTLLNVQHSYLTGKLALQRKNLEQSNVLPVVDEAMTQLKKDNVKGFEAAITTAPTSAQTQCIIAWQQTKTQLEQCETRITEHKKVNLDNTLILNAVLKGFQEGAEAVGMVALPFILLSVVCPYLLLGIFVATLVVGTGRAIQRGLEKKRELDKAKPLVTRAIKPIVQPVTKPVKVKPKSANLWGSWWFNVPQKKPTQRPESFGIELRSIAAAAA